MKHIVIVTMVLAGAFILLTSCETGLTGPETLADSAELFGSGRTLGGGKDGKEANTIAEYLNITEEQKASIKAIVTRYREMDKSAMDREEKRALYTTAAGELASVLTTEQKKRLKTVKQMIFVKRVEGRIQHAPKMLRKADLRQSTKQEIREIMRETKETYSGKIQEMELEERAHLYRTLLRSLWEVLSEEEQNRVREQIQQMEREPVRPMMRLLLSYSDNLSE